MFTIWVSTLCAIIILNTDWDTRDLMNDIGNYPQESPLVSKWYVNDNVVVFREQSCTKGVKDYKSCFLPTKIERLPKDACHDGPASGTVDCGPSVWPNSTPKEWTDETSKVTYTGMPWPIIDSKQDDTMATSVSRIEIDILTYVIFAFTTVYTSLLTCTWFANLFTGKNILNNFFSLWDDDALGLMPIFGKRDYPKGHMLLFSYVLYLAIMICVSIMYSQFNVYVNPRMVNIGYDVSQSTDGAPVTVENLVGGPSASNGIREYQVASIHGPYYRMLQCYTAVMVAGWVMVAYGAIATFTWLLGATDYAVIGTVKLFHPRAFPGANSSARYNKRPSYTSGSYGAGASSGQWGRPMSAIASRA